MPLVDGKKLLANALKHNYAIPAFGFVNLEGAIAAVRAAEKLNAPIILQTTEGGINYAGIEQLSAIAISLAKNAKVPIALHLDHGRNLIYHQQALKLGYTSLMIDGSTLNFDDNVSITNKVSRMIEGTNVSLEAELGRIGGKEDDNEDKGDNYTNFDDAINFINQTKIDMLAIACGTSHGFYLKEPKINQELIKKIYQKTHLPLVLHGGSDIPLEQITEAVTNGIRKANFDSELKKEFITGILDYVSINESAYDIRKIFEPGILRMQRLAETKIKAVKAENKNWLNS